MEKNKASDINEKIEEYRSIITHFTALLEEENEALRKYDMEKVSTLLDKKVQIVSSYRTMAGYFIKNQEILKAATETSKQEIKDISIKLDTLMKENERLLKTKMETSRTVMDSIVRMAKKVSSTSSTSYGSGGTYTPVDNMQNAFAINRTL